MRHYEPGGDHSREFGTMNATVRVHMAAALAAMSGIVLAVSHKDWETVHAATTPVTWRQQVAPLVTKTAPAVTIPVARVHSR